MSTEAITASLITEATSAPTEAVETQEASSSEDVALSPQLAILAKKEKSILMEKQKLAQKLKEIEEKQSKLGQWEELDRLASENPAEFFKKKGLSFEQIQQKMLESLQDEDLDPIQKQIKELQSKLASKDEEVKKLLEETLSERETKAKEAEIEQQSKHYNAELKKFIESNSDNYDLIKTFGAEDEVFSVIKEVYLKTAESGTPKLMTFEEACGLYEKKLEELVQGMKKSKKVSSIFGNQTEDDPFAKVFGQTTLDDSFSQSSATSPELKSEEERLKAAAKLFQQQINGI